MDNNEIYKLTEVDIYTKRSQYKELLLKLLSNKIFMADFSSIISRDATHDPNLAIKKEGMRAMLYHISNLTHQKLENPEQTKLHIKK